MQLQINLEQSDILCYHEWANEYYRHCKIPENQHVLSQYKGILEQINERTERLEKLNHEMSQMEYLRLSDKAQRCQEIAAFQEEIARYKNDIQWYKDALPKGRSNDSLESDDITARLQLRVVQIHAETWESVNRSHIVRLEEKNQELIGRVKELTKGQKIEELTKECEPFVDLNNKISRLQAERNKLLNYLQQLNWEEAKVVGTISPISKLYEKYQILTHERYQQFNSFEKNPSRFFNKLLESMREVVTRYENENLMNQSEDVRYALATIKNSIEVLDKKQFSHKNDWIDGYYLLANAYWTSVRKLTLKSRNEKLSKQLEEIRTTLLITEKTFLNVAEDACARLSQSRGLAIALPKYESMQYQKANEDVTAKLEILKQNPQLEKLIRHVEKMVSLIDKIKERDKKFYTTILNKTTQYLNNPGNKKLQKEYMQLAELSKQTETSSWRTLGYLMLSLVSIVSIVLCPLITVKIGVGASLIASIGFFHQSKVSSQMFKLLDITKTVSGCLDEVTPSLVHEVKEKHHENFITDQDVYTSSDEVAWRIPLNV